MSYSCRASSSPSALAHPYLNWSNVRVIAHAAYKRQKHNKSVTEIARIPNRGHSLTIDSGWREVAQTALDFVKRFV